MTIQEQVAQLIEEMVCDFTNKEMAERIHRLYEDEGYDFAMKSAIASLQGRIEWVGAELDRLQAEYRKLTGKDHVWWR
jgi:polyhydroxyalkanoate synthesis regulator phasin